jgi:hypothetical protein
VNGLNTYITDGFVPLSTAILSSTCNIAVEIKYVNITQVTLEALGYSPMWNHLYVNAVNIRIPILPAINEQAYKAIGL